MEVKLKKSFWKGKKVLVTGHTGFKGTWLCLLLEKLGADVIGYALAPTTESGEKFFSFAKSSIKNNFIEDIRNFSILHQAFLETSPEIVFHLAAQPIVSIGYQNPVETYETNVMGTVNLLECARRQKTVKSLVNVTTDKVYRNREWIWGYRETDSLGGQDPYANSKSCSELVTQSYCDSFFYEAGVAVSTARAGNVIGGGDFSVNRIIPDCIRAAYKKESISVRHPESIRPYQHVLEPLTAYLLIAQKQYEEPEFAGNYNVGPDEENCVSTGALADIFCRLWGEQLTWKSVFMEMPHESRLLRLDCSLFKSRFGWRPKWDIQTAVMHTIAFAKEWKLGTGIRECLEQQIDDYWRGFIDEG